MSNPRIVRVILIQIVTGALSATTLTIVLLGNWDWWRMFVLTYGITLTIAVVFLLSCDVGNPFDVIAAGFLSLLIPSLLHVLITSTAPPATSTCTGGVCTIEFVLLFPFGAFSFLSVVLPMLGLQSFCCSSTYLIARKVSLMKTGSILEIKVDPSRFVTLLIKSYGQLLGTFSLVITIAQNWLLKGDLSMTLSLMILLQFLFPFYLVLLDYLEVRAGKRGVWYEIIEMWPFINLVLAVFLPQTPSILSLILHPSDWRSPLLASFTATTLWGMSIARALVASD
jgi:hypothetical protein